MDNNLDLSALANADGAVGDAVSKLLARPDLLMNLASELGLAPKNEEIPNEDYREKNDERKNDAPPISKQESGNIPDKKKLLLALRPYVSEKRREALDMMINLDSIGRLVGNIDPSVIMKMLGGGATNV